MRPNGVEGAGGPRWLALGALLAVSACHKRGHPGGDSRPTTPIGVITALSGPDAVHGEAHVRGFAIALDEINAQGGVLGKPVRLVTYDDEGKPEAAVGAARKLLDQDRVLVVIGPSSGETASAIEPVIERGEVALVVPSATGDGAAPRVSPWVFRLCAGQSDYASAILDMVKDNGRPTTIAFVYENTASGRSQLGAMKRAVATSTIRVVAEEAYDAGGASFAPMLQRVRANQPEIVFFASHEPDAAHLVLESHRVGLQARYFASMDAAFGDPDFPTADRGAGRDGEYAVAASQWAPTAKWPGADNFDEKFLARYRALPTADAVAAYSALKVVVAAMERAGKLEPTAIRDALKVGRIDSPFGPVAFADDGRNRHAVVITQVQNGKQNVVWPRAVAVAPVLEMPPWSDRE
jgi:branched-chain amino acid transport system substrate-binding protein